MKEKDIQVIFGKKNKIRGAFELKLCKTKSIRWDAVNPHQIASLSEIKHIGLYHKIADTTSYSGGTRAKPFDCFNFQCDAYVVICFYVPRKYKRYYYIDIDSYIKEMKIAPRKSFRQCDALAMCEFNFDL